MRYILAWIMIAVCALLLSYSIWAFILWELNPERWKDVPRILFLSFAVWFIYIFKTKPIK